MTPQYLLYLRGPNRTTLRLSYDLGEKIGALAAPYEGRDRGVSRERKRFTVFGYFRAEPAGRRLIITNIEGANHKRLNFVPRNDEPKAEPHSFLTFHWDEPSDWILERESEAFSGREWVFRPYTAEDRPQTVAAPAAPKPAPAPAKPAATAELWEAFKELANSQRILEKQIAELTQTNKDLVAANELLTEQASSYETRFENQELRIRNLETEIQKKHPNAPAETTNPQRKKLEGKKVAIVGFTPIQTQSILQRMKASLPGVEVQEVKEAINTTFPSTALVVLERNHQAESIKCHLRKCGVPYITNVSNADLICKEVQRHLEHAA